MWYIILQDDLYSALGKENEWINAFASIWLWMNLKLLFGGKIFCLIPSNILLRILVHSIIVHTLLLSFIYFSGYPRNTCTLASLKTSLPKSEFYVSMNFWGEEGWFQGEVKQADCFIDSGNLNRTVESLHIFCFGFIIEHVLDQITVCFCM